MARCAPTVWIRVTEVMAPGRHERCELRRGQDAVNQWGIDAIVARERGCGTVFRLANFDDRNWRRDRYGLFLGSSLR